MHDLNDISLEEMCRFFKDLLIKVLVMKIVITFLIALEIIQVLWVTVLIAAYKKYRCQNG
jgi:hypothetical protein